jgi:hypothetical protein
VAVSINWTVRVKLSLCLTKHHAMKAYWGVEVSGQLHDPAALPPGEDPLVHLDRRLGGPQSSSGRGGEEKNSQPPPGIEHKIGVCLHICLCVCTPMSKNFTFLYEGVFKSFRTGRLEREL